MEPESERKFFKIQSQFSSTKPLQLHAISLPRRQNFKIKFGCGEKIENVPLTRIHSQ